MQAEVSFDNVYGPLGWWMTENLTEGLLQIVVSVLVLLAMAPGLSRPMLARALGPAAASHLAIPGHRERLFLALTGAAAFGGVVQLIAAQFPGNWSYLSLGPAGVVGDFAAFGLAFRWALVAAAILGSAALISSLAQLTADARFGAGFAALALVGGALSIAIVCGAGQPLLWLGVWFPICVSVAAFCRFVPHSAWLAICCVALPTLVLAAIVTIFAVANGAVEWMGIVWNVVIKG